MSEAIHHEDYGEESWPDQSPWEEAPDQSSDEEEREDGSRKDRERGDYSEERDHGRDDHTPDESTRRDRNISELTVADPWKDREEPGDTPLPGVLVAGPSEPRTPRPPGHIPGPTRAYARWCAEIDAAWDEAPTPSGYRSHEARKKGFAVAADDAKREVVLGFIDRPLPPHEQHIKQLEARDWQTRQERQEVEDLKRRREEADDEIREAVRTAHARLWDSGSDNRGGNRERRQHKAKRLFPGELTDGPGYRFDFHARQHNHGPGKARDDENAIREWLTADLIELEGRRWIKSPGCVVHELDDWKPQRGKSTAPELVKRVRELAADGAFKRTIAGILDVSERTVTRWIES
jgi:hypothetical protein